MPVVPRSSDVLKQGCLQSFKTRSTDLIKNTKNQGVAVVPRRSDVLKQGCLQSFKTRRPNFDKDVKIRSWFQRVNTSHPYV
ncbi:conserved hypothetical protein [Treponema phagedenis]|uniref:Uncharacterized protein n=1 Tax=Treponema phagedenis TaxID=162 RepID=A0A0B7GXZ2_TREPH|nr:conserved hypothetical protein [Treponema phagedenis]